MPLEQNGDVGLEELNSSRLLHPEARRDQSLPVDELEERRAELEEFGGGDSQGTRTRPGGIGLIGADSGGT